MSPEKWQQTVGLIKDKFEISREDQTQEEIGSDANDQPVFEYKETIEFTSPIGKIKFEFIKRPVIVDKITNYSRRIGGDIGVKYTFSSDESTYKLQIYKWDDLKNEWQELDTNNFSMV